MEDICHFIDSSAVNISGADTAEIFVERCKEREKTFEMWVFAHESFHEFASSNTIATIHEVLQEQDPLMLELRRTLNMEKAFRKENIFIQRLEESIIAYEKSICHLEKSLVSQKNFNKKQQIIYKYALHETRNSHHIKVKSFGASINTDKKLIATTLSYAMNTPVSLISRDKDMISSLKDSIKNVIYGTGAREEGLFPNPIYAVLMSDQHYFHPQKLKFEKIYEN